jgi:hypothetical protein
MRLDACCGRVARDQGEIEGECSGVRGILITAGVVFWVLEFFLPLLSVCGKSCTNQWVRAQVG